MTDEVISPLRRRMIEDMTIRRVSGSAGEISADDHRGTSATSQWRCASDCRSRGGATGTHQGHR
jgi:hypothetical protein